MILAALNERGHAGLIGLDCHPEPGGVRAARLIVAADTPAGEYAGEQVLDKNTEPVRVIVPALEAGIHTDAFIEVRHGE